MITKPKKDKPESYYRNKADKLLQELGRKTFDRCEICGGEYSCLHHYFPKSMSTVLRYDMENCIPICVGCHFKHHNGNPLPHAIITRIRGDNWVKELDEKRKEAIGQKFGRPWFKEKVELLTGLV